MVESIVRNDEVVGSIPTGPHAANKTLYLGIRRELSSRNARSRVGRRSELTTPK